MVSTRLETYHLANIYIYIYINFSFVFFIFIFSRGKAHDETGPERNTWMKYIVLPYMHSSVLFLLTYLDTLLGFAGAAVQKELCENTDAGADS